MKGNVSKTIKNKQINWRFFLAYIAENVEGVMENQKNS